MTLPYITEHINQPIELNNVNPEITAETIYEHTVIDEVHDKETKPESNDESTTGLVEPEIKPEQDSHKPKTNNWIYVLCFIGFAVVIVICFICWIKFRKSSIVELYFNQEQNSWHICNKGDKEYNLRDEDFYIDRIFYYLWDYCNIYPEDEAKTIKKNGVEDKKKLEIDLSKIEIDLSKIQLNDCVVFAFESDYYDIFFKDKEIKNIIIWQANILFQKNKEAIKALKQLNSKINSQENLDKFMEHFIKVTKKQIAENEVELRKITDFTTFINRGLKYFPKLELVQQWDPNQEST